MSTGIIVLIIVLSFVALNHIVDIIDKKVNGIKIRPPVYSFALDMEYKLKLNDHKGGWTQNGFVSLYSRLLDEVEELEANIKNCDNHDNPDNNYWMSLTKTKEEAVDVANFAMMIHNNAKRYLGEDV